ncbi:MAG TPA: FlgD immunoglobulin-like domain containing protein, partial [Candidatus Krumholzibacteria bacterium]|nr:FlgD immunoglobulin-like domain containing protein [Candidatus Krumholzibacteria bacterium]
ILALASITATTGAAVEGRLLARNGAVTLDTNLIGSEIPADIIAPTAGSAVPAEKATGVANSVRLASNPLRSGSATIRFGLARADRVEIKVYNVGGRLVRSLANREFEPGEHEVVWDRLDARGGPVPHGMYFTRVTYSNQGFVATKKLVIIE